MKEISVIELKQWQDNGENFLLIDIREKLEFETGNINGHHIPMGEMINRLDEIPTDTKVVIHCKSGGRSTNMIRYLSVEKGFTNLYNLIGGISEWKEKINPQIQVL